MASSGQERKPTSAELQESKSTKKGSKKKSPKVSKDKKQSTVAECDRVIEINDEELAELEAQEAAQQSERRRRDLSVPTPRSGVFGFFKSTSSSSRKDASRQETSTKSDAKTPEKSDKAPKSDKKTPKSDKKTTKSDKKTPTSDKKTYKKTGKMTPETPEEGDSAQATSLSPGACALPGRSPGQQSGGDTSDDNQGKKKDRSSKRSPSFFSKFFKSSKSRDASPETTLTSPKKGITAGKESSRRGQKSGKSPSESAKVSASSSPSTQSKATPEKRGPSKQRIAMLSPRPNILYDIPSIIVEGDEVSVSSKSIISGDAQTEKKETSRHLLATPKQKSRRVSPSKHTPPFGLRGTRSPSTPGASPVTHVIPTQHTPPFGLGVTLSPVSSLAASLLAHLTQTQHTPRSGLRTRSIPCIATSQDLSAFDMPLISPNIPENMAEAHEFERPRSSSGSTALKGLLTSKSKSRNKSVDREDKKEKDKDKKRGFFEQFRPRSKSDVSGLKRPAKKTSLPTDRSMDESALIAQSNFKPLVGSQEAITPMGQILEGQMLNVPDEDRCRHKSMPSGARDGSFMSKIRTFSSSEAKPPKSPKRPAQSQRSPPSSPLADRSGLSPLKLQSGEPRSAPPGLHRGSVFGDRDPAHALSRSDILNRMPADLGERMVGERMEVEDTDGNIDQAFSKFMRAHKCYDIIPTSAKLVIFDTQLNVKKAFFALIYNDVRAAPLWDTELQDYVGMLTITDFIAILRRFYKSVGGRLDELEDHKIMDWRKFEKKENSFICIGPDATLYEAVRSLVESHVHRLPVVDEASGNALYILTHKRILRFLHMFKKTLRTPSFMQSSLRDLGIGTYENVITATPETKVITALNLFMDHRVSALPVVNSVGEVVNIYAKFDVITLAAAKSYNNLDITIEDALKNRQTGEGTEPVATCFLSETLSSVIDKIVRAEVHRLVIVDERNHVKGILSLSDILKYIIIRPMAVASATEHVAEDQPPLDEEPTILEETSHLEPELRGAEASESSHTSS